jgi:hypothetical protein
MPLEGMMQCLWMTILQMRARMRYGWVPVLLPTNLIPFDQEEEFYSPGSLELLEARRRIAEYSLPRLDFISAWRIAHRCLLYFCFFLCIAELKSE